MIIDMILPVIDGIGVLEQIREQGVKGKSKIIMVSGVSEDFFIRKSFESGADYILQKPIAYEAFYGRARDLLEKDEKGCAVCQPEWKWGRGIFAYHYKSAASAGPFSRFKRLFLMRVRQYASFLRNRIC